MWYYGNSILNIGVLKMKTAILTDSSAVIDPKVAKELQIKVLALPLSLGQTIYHEGQDISDKDLLALANSTKEALNIASVARKDIDFLFKELEKEGYTDVICIHLSNGINALDENLKAYATENESALKIHLFDSHTTGLAQAKMVRKAAKAVNDGLSVEKVLELLETMRENTQTIVIDDIRNLQKTGYVSNGAPVMGNALLRLKTLLEFTDDGSLAVLDTSMRMKKAYKKVVQQFPTADSEDLSVMLMCDQRHLEKFDKWIKRFKDDYPKATLEVADLKPSIRAYMGKKSLLISWNYAK